MTGNADVIKTLHNILLNMCHWPINPAIIKSLSIPFLSLLFCNNSNRYAN